ncbi:MAG: double zinc ribbon domain-containing protein [Treponema sp.]|jgi:predicted amidophosphoribosyltransferase|nr:double zinc ribbon domain-containing protein [Treponema sp.]
MDFVQNNYSGTPGGIAGRALFFLREYFFPAGCALCGAALVTMNEAWYGLCEPCHAELERAWAPERGGAGERCDRCGRPLISERGRCLSCRNSGAPAFDRVIAFFPYAGGYRRLLAAYKFGKNLALGNFFAEWVRNRLYGGGFFAATTCMAPPGALVPVPPRPGKLRTSGWDQVEYLARLLEKGRGSGGQHKHADVLPGKKKYTGLPVSRCLRRLPSKIQKELNREDRKTNLRGRIVLQAGAPKTAILIDDVITTGSTMDVCASVLKEGGAERVFGLCLFYD